MKQQLRHLIAKVLYPVKAYTLPSVCERYGMESGDASEAFSSKTAYIMRRLEKLSDEQVFRIAKDVIQDYPDDDLQAAVEKIEKEGRLVTDITRHHLADALDRFSLSGKRSLLELLEKHWPSINDDCWDLPSIADNIKRHAIHNDDWKNSDVLEQVGFLTCSQSRLFAFLEDILHPLRREGEEQKAIIVSLNPILERDGYKLIEGRRISGYPSYKVVEVTPTGAYPADELISQVLVSFDESGVHAAWRKALDRRSTDPDGAITAAKTLLETVCKHIIEEAGSVYGENDDLPKLYKQAAEQMSLAPSQHTEETFKRILGSCEQVVSRLSHLRNKVGDAHGQGKKRYRPHARHAELAVNLAGTMATFLVSTWNARQNP